MHPSTDQQLRSFAICHLRFHRAPTKHTIIYLKQSILLRSKQPPMPPKNEESDDQDLGLGSLAVTDADANADANADEAEEVVGDGATPFEYMYDYAAEDSADFATLPSLPGFEGMSDHAILDLLSGATSITASTIDPSQDPAVTVPPRPSGDGPFQIGDRVIIHGLTSASCAFMNGRHGTIASPYLPPDEGRKMPGRYSIDLDIYDPRHPSTTSVPATRLRNEPKISEPNVQSRAELDEKGCLLERDGRTLSFVCATMRQSVEGALPENARPIDAVNFAHSYWLMPGQGGVYPTLLQFLAGGAGSGILQHNTLEEVEMQLHPSDPEGREGAYDHLKTVLTDPRAVGGWNVRVTGDFWIMGANEEGTLIVPCNNVQQVYCVVGLRIPLALQAMMMMKPHTTDLGELQWSSPPKFHLTLLPWFGRLVHDPIIVPSSGDVMNVEMAGDVLTEELVQNVRLAMVEKRIVGGLNQLEVPEGSRMGVPFVPFFPSESVEARESQVMAKEQEGATEAELGLVDNFTMFEAVEMTPGANGMPPPNAAWNFVRKEGEAEMTILNAAGEEMDVLTVQDIAQPTAVELLKKMVQMAAGDKVGEKGKRSAVVGVDCAEAAARLHFLLKEVKDVKVVKISMK